MEYIDILKRINKAVKRFNKRIPAAQRAAYESVTEELKRLDLKAGNIKATVGNLKIIASVKNKLQRLILSDAYVKELKVFVKTFNEITTLQNDYWKSLEPSYKPVKILKEIRNQAVADTVDRLTENGIAQTIGNEISEILRANITTGGSYRTLQAQLSDKLTGNNGAMVSRVRQITVDAVNTYNAQYTQTVSSDLGFEWYAWQGSELQTSRPFCQAMVENNRYFHVSQIPNLLKGLDVNGKPLEYKDNKTNEIKKVTVSEKTGLPSGFIAGTNVSNFLINRGGYLCGHQAGPVSERLIKRNDPEYYQQVLNTAAYKGWKGL